MSVLETVRSLDLPDWLIFSGAVYQPVLNHLTGRDPDYGIKDYDLAYFDASDISYDAEDVVIRKVVWFESKFGEPYAPLSCSAEALDRFVSATFAVGVRIDRGGRLTIIAPFGLDDLFALRMRPNPTRRTNGFARAVASLTARWPELKVELE